MSLRRVVVWCAVLACVALLCGVLEVSAVDRKKFRTCKETAFCQRNRHSPDVAKADSTQRFHLLVRRTCVHCSRQLTAPIALPQR